MRLTVDARAAAAAAQEMEEEVRKAREAAQKSIAEQRELYESKMRQGAVRALRALLACCIRR